MAPEFTAYQYSPHARVSCTACHVGPGAGWYARSRLSGLYQVYATLANVYPRPIAAPIEHLRPAQATCEQCHWPEKFFGAKQKIIIMSQGGKRPHPETLPAGGLALEHPVDIGEAWKGALCSDCHKGALP